MNFTRHIIISFSVGLFVLYSYGQQRIHQQKEQGNLYYQDFVMTYKGDVFTGEVYDTYEDGSNK